MRDLEDDMGRSEFEQVRDDEDLEDDEDLSLCQGCGLPLDRCDCEEETDA